MRNNLGFVRILRNEPSAARPFFVAALDNSRRAGRPDRVVCALLGLAVCASQEGDTQRAAQLHGVTDALVHKIGIAFETLEERVQHDDIERLRRMLGDEQFTAAYEHGRAIPTDEGVALARQAPGRIPAPHG